jgi:retron-type reverse transcriptase
MSEQSKKVTNMKGGKQKIFETAKTCPQKDRTASNGYVGGQTFMRITENNLTSDENRIENGLLEQILSPTNLNQAYKQVKRNKGASGVDKMEAEFLKDYLVKNNDNLIGSIQGGKYRPKPDGFTYPKETGNSADWVSLR